MMAISTFRWWPSMGDDEYVDEWLIYGWLNDDEMMIVGYGWWLMVNG